VVDSGRQPLSVTPTEAILVMKKLDCLRIDKSPGADNMSPRVPVELKDVIVFPVTLSMKCSLASGVVPEDWKTDNVSPIHKSGAKSHASNYRPVTYVSCLNQS